MTNIIQRRSCHGAKIRMSTLLVSMSYRYRPFCERERVPSPTVVATVGPHPSQPTITVFAKISPNPSITPFTKGKNMLMDNEESNAQKRALAGSEESKTASVADAAIAGRAAGAAVVLVVRGA